VAVYMIVMAVTVLVAAMLAPETRDRDLTDGRDALAERPESMRA
jgi:hypothetical protein